MRWERLSWGESLESAQGVIHQAIADVERAWGCTVLVHDRTGMLRRRGFSHLLEDRYRMHTHSYCAWRRQPGDAWDQACYSHCWQEVGERLAEGPGLHSCWKGGRELVVPITQEGVLLFALFAGMFRGDPPATDVRDPGLERRWRALPEMPVDQVIPMMHDLHRLGLLLCELLAKENLDVAGRRQRIEGFIAQHACRNPPLGELASLLGISPGHCSHEVSRLLGVTFQQAVQVRRLAEAADLLRTTTLTVGEIARRTGYDNQYHFNRLFRRHYGAPPGRWRRNQRGPPTG